MGVAGASAAPVRPARAAAASRAMCEAGTTASSEPWASRIGPRYRAIAAEALTSVTWWPRGRR